jgi:hypothetical protein
VKVTVIRESRAIDVARNVSNGGGQHESLAASVPEPASQVQPEPAPEPQVQPDQAA